jgi:RsiW-degrading membrane proteinase PrsW (M82 family)
MLGMAMRLLAAGEAGRRLGDYVKNSVTKYLVLSMAGIVFAIAIIFAMLAIFWELSSRTGPVNSAVIMAVALAIIGCLIALIAYGTTRRKPQSVRQAFADPAAAARAQLPTVDEAGRQIEEAVRQYGPFRVVAVAAASGLVAGLLAKRFGQAPVYERPWPSERRPRNGRRRYEEASWR